MNACYDCSCATNVCFLRNKHNPSSCTCRHCGMKAHHQHPSFSFRSPAASPQFPCFLAAGGRVAKPGGQSPSRPQAAPGSALQSGTASTAILNLSTRYRDNGDARPLSSFTKVIKLEQSLERGRGGSYLMWPFCSNGDLCIKRWERTSKDTFLALRTVCVSGGRTTREFFSPLFFFPPPLRAPKALMYTKENLCNHIKRSWGEYNQASFSITIRKLFL